MPLVALLHNFTVDLGSGTQADGEYFTALPLRAPLSLDLLGLMRVTRN